MPEPLARQRRGISQDLSQGQQILGLETLDVILGLIFVYLLLSLVCTAINEIVAQWLNGLHRRFRKVFARSSRLDAVATAERLNQQLQVKQEAEQAAAARLVARWEDVPENPRRPGRILDRAQAELRVAQLCSHPIIAGLSQARKLTILLKRTTLPFLHSCPTPSPPRCWTSSLWPQPPRDTQ